MIAHDPVKAPLASDVRYTENGQPLAIGDGLWRTLTARAEHALYLTGEQDVGDLHADRRDGHSRPAHAAPS